MGINRKRRPFLSRASILLLVFLIIFTASSPFISAPPAAAGSWAGWGSMNTIAILPTSDEYLDTASQELETYLEQMSGWSWQIVLGDIGGPAIRLDVNPGSDNLTGRSDEAVELLSDDNGIRITGKTSFATRHGAYILLEKLGYRSFFKTPVWEVVPTSLTDLGAFDEVHEPFYWDRWIGIGRQGIGPWNELDANWKVRNRLKSPVSYPIAHTYNAIITYSSYGSKEALYAVHPDWFTPSDWDGSSFGWQLKCDEPGVIDLATEYARSWLNDPGYGAAPISPNDGRGWDPPWSDSQTVTDKVFYLTNEVAKALQAEFPGKYIQTYAYSNYSYVPTFDLEPNVMAQISTHYNESGLTLDEQIDGFRARGAQVGIRGYLDVFTWYEDTPDSHSAELNIIKSAANKGVRIYNTEATDAWGARGLTFYTAAKLLWDPTLDIQAIYNDFYDKAFGPASESMKHLWETGWGSYQNYYNMSEVFATFAEAELLAAGDETILERIRQMELYWRFVWKWHVEGVSDLSNLSLDDLTSLYTFVTKLDTLYLLQQPRAEGMLTTELAARGLLPAEITALVDRTPPTTAETAAWLAEGLAAYPEITEPLPNPLGVDLAPLGDTAQPRLEPLYGQEKTVLVQTAGSETITVLVKSKGRMKVEWYDPMGLKVDEFYHNSSSPLPPTSINFSTIYPGCYFLHMSSYYNDGSMDVPNHPAAMLAHPALDLFTFDSEETMNAPYYASSLLTGVVNEQYFYVPAGTPSFVFGTQIGGDLCGGDVTKTATGTLTNPDGNTALSFTHPGTDPIVPEEWTFDNPIEGVWKITIDIDKYGEGYFWLRDILPLVWHDAKYLLSTITLPTVTTNSATNRGANIATLHGNLDSRGTGLGVDLSFEWGTSSGNYTNETPPLLTQELTPYSFNLTGLSANTTYYFRSKAVGGGTSYGNELNFTTLTSGCFIATAAYGTDTANEIQILRCFRDDVLLTNKLGAGFVSSYYQFSPPIADFISQHEVLRTIVREGIVDPIVVILKWSYDLWSK